MTSCPLCLQRSAKRYCPAKDAHICAVCCGTHREVDIDCPTDCKHLKAGWLYETQKGGPDPQLIAQIRRFNDDFLHRFSTIMDAISGALAEEAIRSRWLGDQDVIEVFRCLSATLKTLSSGIYYESLPSGAVRISLFRKLREVLDQFMKPQAAPDLRSLKVSEALEILEFFTLSAQLNSNARPKSRRYLDWLLSMAPPVPEQSSLIIP